MKKRSDRIFAFDSKHPEVIAEWRKLYNSLDIVRITKEPNEKTYRAYYKYFRGSGLLALECYIEIPKWLYNEVFVNRL